MIPHVRIQRLAWHDATCPEGPECRDRDIHTLSNTIVNSGMIARYHEALEALGWPFGEDLKVGPGQRLVDGEVLTDCPCARARGVELRAHGAHRWEENEAEAELAEAAALPPGPFWCEGLRVHPATQIGGGGA